MLQIIHTEDKFLQWYNQEITVYVIVHEVKVYEMAPAGQSCFQNIHIFQLLFREGAFIMMHCLVVRYDCAKFLRYFLIRACSSNFDGNIILRLLEHLVLSNKTILPCKINLNIAYIVFVLKSWNLMFLFVLLFFEVLQFSVEVLITSSVVAINNFFKVLIQMALSLARCSKMEKSKIEPSQNIWFQVSVGLSTVQYNLSLEHTEGSYYR